MPYEDASVAEAVSRLKRELLGRMAALKKANLDDRGAEHAERLEERIEGDIAQLQSHAYFDAMEYYLPYLYPDAVCALDYIPDNALIILDEPTQAKARWEQRETEIAEIMAARAARGEYLTPDMPHACGFETVITALPKASATVLLALLGRGLDGIKIDKTNSIPTQAGAMENFAARLPAFFEALDGWLGARFRCVLVTEQSERLRQILADHKIPASPLDRLEPGGEAGVFVVTGSVLGGFKLPEANLMLATDTDIFGHRAHQKPPRRAFKEGLKITSYLELREGTSSSTSSTASGATAG